MNKERSDQILNTGMKAAREQLSRRPSKGEYPRDYNRLYAWLEDMLFALYESILLRKTRHIFEAAGEIIFTTSEIAEFANTEMNYEKITKGDKSDEMADNKH